jgi:hypothetical protein
MKQIIICCLCIILSIPAFTQSLTPSVVASSGNDHENEGVSLSWTLGEIAIKTLETETIILTQGFHQGDILVDAIEKVIDENFTIRIFPNPTNQSVTIELFRQDPVRVYIEVIDINGKLLSNKQVEATDNQAEIDFSHYIPATYFLRIKTPDNKLNITYPIIKQ